MHPDEMFRTLPWPFPGGAFPRALGAVVQKTVLDGRRPALIVGHSEDGDWYVGDGVDDPNIQGACIATHLHHVLDRDDTIESLASLPPGHEAVRDTPDEPWRIARAQLEP